MSQRSQRRRQREQYGSTRGLYGEGGSRSRGEFGGYGMGGEQRRGRSRSRTGRGGTQQTRLVAQPQGLYAEAFADHLTEEMRTCLDDCIDVAHVGEWCADRCLEAGPDHVDAARLSDEVADVAALAAKFIARDSYTTPAVLEAFVEAGEEAIDELERVDAPHTEETAIVIDEAIESALTVLNER